MVLRESPPGAAFTGWVPGISFRPLGSGRRTPGSSARPEPSVHRVRASRSLGRALRLGAAVAVVVALFIATTSAGTGDCQQLFLATFTGLSDGPVGSTVPVETGHLSIVTSSGRLPVDVVPKTAICSERLLVSDVGTLATNDVTVQLQPTGDAANGASISMALRQEVDCTAFGGDVSDGSTTDMLCFDVSGGALS